MGEVSLASPRYTDEILAWEYDQRNAELAAGELPWYLKHAARAGGRLLELACGSGRLLIPIAEAGHRIDGVDNSDAMLARLRVKVDALDDSTQGLIRVFCADMMDFVPTDQYSMVLIGLNSLQYLETGNRILSCFRHVHEVLHSDGLFLFMMDRPDLSKYAGGRRLVRDWMDKPISDPQTSTSVGSRVVSYIELGGERIVKERTYRIIQDRESSRLVECVTYSPILDIHEYVTMLEQSGFTTEVFSGYEELPENGIDRTVCFVCRKRGS